jgi:hypothetical protein
MDEHKIYAVNLDELFPDLEGPIIAHGTSGEILEQIAGRWGLEDEDENPDLGLSLDGVYPSTRAIRAHQILEDRIGRHGAFETPDLLMDALLQDGIIRHVTDDEFEDWVDDEEMDEYEEARGTLDDEWTDGLWET